VRSFSTTFGGAVTTNTKLSVTVAQTKLHDDDDNDDEIEEMIPWHYTMTIIMAKLLVINYQQKQLHTQLNAGIQ